MISVRLHHIRTMGCLSSIFSLCESRALGVFFWNFDADDVVTASLTSSRFYALVAVAEWMFGGRKWEFRAIRICYFNLVENTIKKIYCFCLFSSLSPQTSALR